MARKTSTVPTKVYTYGCLRPTSEVQDILFSQLRLQTDYRNALIAIENRRRADFRALRSTVCPQISEIEARIAPLVQRLEELRLELATVKRKDRKDHPLSKARSDVAKELRDLRTPLKEARAAFTAVFKDADDLFVSRLKAAAKGKGPRLVGEIRTRLCQEFLDSSDIAEVWKQKTRIEMQARAAALAARANSKLFCGNYMLVDQAFAQSKTNTQSDPGPYRSHGRGRIGIQLQHGLGVSELLSGQDPRMQLTLTEGGKMRSFYKRRGAKFGHVTLRLGAGNKSAANNFEGSEPVSITLPVFVHRPIPPDARIMWAWIKIEKLGAVHHFKLQLALESSQFPSKPQATSGSCAINLGWRRLPSGDVRFGYLWDGRVGRSLELPSSVFEINDHARSLIRISDMCFDRARSFLKERLSSMPDWLIQDCENLGHWRSHEKLARVARKLVGEAFEDPKTCEQLFRDWCEYRLGTMKQRVDRRREGRRLQRAGKARAEPPDLFPEDRQVLAFRPDVLRNEVQRVAWYLYVWLDKDRHLLQWHQGLAKRAERRKKQIFNVVAAEIAAKYHTVICEDWDKRDTAKVPVGENDTRTEQEVAASGLRHQVGVSHFSMALKRYATRVLELDASDSTSFHVDCGVRTNDNEVLQVPLLCPKCQFYYDQDLNTAQHLLLRSEQPSKIAAE